MADMADRVNMADIDADKRVNAAISRPESGNPLAILAELHITDR
jgi:hypothetical protein